MIMSYEEHEQILLEVIEELRKKKLRVIRLKPMPDGIVILNNQVVAIEITSGNSPQLYRRKKRYENSDFDEVILIGKNFGNYTPPEAYLMALELRKKGFKYKHIKEVLEKEYPDFSISLAQLSRWCTGKAKPRLLKKGTYH